MKYIQYMLTACLFLMLGASCENDGFYYQDEPRIRMEGPEEWTLETDSLLLNRQIENTGASILTFSKCQIFS